MADLTSQLIVRLIDQVSGPAKAAAASLGMLLRLAGASTKNLGSLQTIGRNLNGVVRNVEKLGAAVSGPLAVAGAFGLKAAYSFEKAGNFLEALGDINADQRKEFEKTAQVLNGQYAQGLTEIVNAANELLKAGLDFQQMQGAIGPTLATAILGQMKPDEVANMISGTLNAFQMPKETTAQALDSVTKITDRMTYAANKSTASLRDMGEMFKYVAGAAAATGNQIDDITAMAMAFSANKINGSEAGIALRSAIVRLATGLTKEGRAAMERVGLSLNDYMQGAVKITPERVTAGLLAGGIDATPIKAAIEQLVNDPALATAPMKLAAKITALVQEQLATSGSAMDAAVIAENVQDSIVAAGSKIDLTRFFTDLQKKLADGTATMGDVAKILEGRHFSKYQALFQADLAKLKEQIGDEASGYTADKYGKTQQGIVGALNQFSAALERFSVAAGKAVFPELTGMLNAMAGAIERFSTSASPETLSTLVKVGAALVAIVPVGIAFSGFAAAASGIAALGTAIAGVVAAIAAVVGAPVIAVAGAITALVAGIVAAVAYWQDIKNFTSSIGHFIASVANLSGRIGSEIVAQLAALGETLRQAGANLMTALWEGMKSVGEAIVGWAAGIASRISNAIGGALNSLPGAKGGNSSASGWNTTPTGKARGGSVTRGRAYIVGERRPELFIPGQSGTIHPNTSLGGAGHQVVFSPSFTFHGQQNAEEIRQVVVRTMRDEVRQMFRGVQFDLGVVFA